MRIWRWRGRTRGCFGRCGRRGSGYAADVVLHGRAAIGNVADENTVDNCCIDLRAQPSEICAAGVISSNLHSEECSRQILYCKLVQFDDNRAETGTREVDRTEGADFLLDSGAIDSYAADLIKTSRIDNAAELFLIASAGQEFSVENSG